MKDFDGMNLPEIVKTLWTRNNKQLKNCFVWEKFSLRRLLLWPLRLPLVLLLYPMIIAGVLFFTVCATVSLPVIVLYNIFKKPAVK